MEIKTKYNVGDHIWVVYEHKGEACVFDEYICAITYDKDGLSYVGSESCEDYTEKEIILYEETDKVIKLLKKIMERIWKEKTNKKTEEK